MGDINRILACWADDEDVICILPTGERVLGLDGVRHAFGQLLEHGGIVVEPEQVIKTSSATSAVHSIMQRVRLHTNDGQIEMYFSATNVYHHTTHGWRMVAHHSSPAMTEIAAAYIDRGPRVLH